MRARVTQPSQPQPSDPHTPSTPPRGSRSRSVSSSAPDLDLTLSPASARMIPLHNMRKDAESTHELHLPPSDSDKFDITDLTIDIPGSQRRRTDEPPPPRWRTPEFMVYYAIFIIVVPMIVWVPMKVSLESNPNRYLYERRLSKGWLYGRKVDASDPQYRTFRSNFFALIGLIIAFTVPSQLARRVWPGASARAKFLACAGLVFMVVMHGISTVKILVILGANYAAAKATKGPQLSRFWGVVVIVANMLVLFANEKADGYKFGALFSGLAFLDSKELAGILPRWQIGFNITMLRIVSFALDAHWRTPPPSSANNPTDQRQRSATSLREEDYSLVNYLAYTLYAPLYIAGPIMTFNDFVWQMQHPVEISRKTRISYAFRFAFCMLTMESILHTMYVVAIKDTEAWHGDGPAELSMIGFWNLIVVWLKLLIPWRFFRLWALLDGVDAPENMVRCVANNYSTLGFWRSWHRSYNLWVVRYIYVPLGGSKRVILATTLVFTFVALWHDLSFKLLAWGWLVSLFIVPELVGRALVPASKYGSRWWYRHVAACGGVANVLLMMGANLVGFVLGIDGMKHLGYELASTAHGWAFTAFACSCLFVGVQVMFEYREDEARRGIDRRC